MIRYLYGDELDRYPHLSRTMFQDRARQFKTRQGWDVSIDMFGEERDEYDRLNPLYVIWEQPNGAHGGSMRFLPTTGRTMVNEHFLDLTDGVKIVSPLIWECTRYCLAPGGGAKVSAALMLAGGEIMEQFAIRHFVGVFDRRMERIYRMIGASPDTQGKRGVGADMIAVGLWAFSQEARQRVSRQAGISATVSNHWFRRAFGAPRQPLLKSA